MAEAPERESDSPGQLRRGDPTVSSIFSERWQRFFVRLIGVAVLATVGCQNMPIDLARGPASLRIPRPGEPAQTFEDSLTGGQVFTMYCNQCHNARALAERPFFNYENIATHMRVRANLTGEEYSKLIAFLERWHDVPSPSAPVEGPPKRFVFSQPIPELREEQQAKERAAEAAAAAGAVAPTPAPGAGANLPPAIP
jgi:hypothetical protein